MTPLLAAAWLCLCGAPASAQPPAPADPWSTDVLTEEELRAGRELQALLKRLSRGQLPRIEFELDSDEIHGESFPTLDAIAHLLLKQQHVKLRIEAHTCSLGSDEHNQDLSERRAKAVADYLIRKGVPPPYVRWRGWGESQPLFDNSTEEGRRRNRRVEFRLVRRDWDSVY
ncbi:MAG: OmpA family protein [Elusimicrobia bacterium]|nr:OmpA family protein [Elusimicrobiota bacterium]